MRPLPSMRTQAMPRRASWAARMVPDAPPPTMATAFRRSDLVVRPALRVGRARLTALDMIVDASHGPAGGLGEPAGHGGMDDRRQASADQLAADLHRSDPVARPAHAERARMRDEQALHHSGTIS